MAVEDEDWVLSFLREFAAMSEQERDAAIDALAPADREAIIAIAEARTATAEADLVRALDSGQAGLDKLHEVSRPADLFTVISLAVRERPNLVVEALFAAVVLHRARDEGESEAIVALREQWHWHVYEQIRMAQERAAEERAADGDDPSTV